MCLAQRRRTRVDTPKGAGVADDGLLVRQLRERIERKPQPRIIALRDYPCRTLAQARYSRVILLRDLRLELITHSEFGELMDRCVAAIRRFEHGDHGQALLGRSDTVHTNARR